MILAFVKTKSTTIGEYEKVDMYLPCYLDNELVLYNVQSYVN